MGRMGFNIARQEHRCENRMPRNCTKLHEETARQPLHEIARNCTKLHEIARNLHEICTPRTSPQKPHANRCTKLHEIARICTKFARQEHRRRNRTPAVARNCTKLHEFARNCTKFARQEDGNTVTETCVCQNPSFLGEI